MANKSRLLLIVLTCCSKIAFAAASGGGAVGNSVGVLLGVGWVDTSSNTMAVGVELRFPLVDKVPLGIYYLTYGSSIQIEHEDPTYTADVSSSAKQYGFTLGYKVNFLPGGELGLRAAYVQAENQAIVTTNGVGRVDNLDSGHSFTVAPRVSIEIPFGKASIGSEVDYFVGLGQNAPSGFFFLVPLRYYY